jgi:hypothetical protein
MGCHLEMQMQFLELETAASIQGDEMLEPYEGKLSRTVLRGLETGNGLRLLGDDGEK